jgi:hypothetical protein
MRLFLRTLVVLAVVGVLLVPGYVQSGPGRGVPSAAAMEAWCDGDPVVVVVTPGGALVPLFVTSSGLGVQHLPAVLLAAITYTTELADGGTATLVKLRVVVPGDLFDPRFATRSVVSTGPLGTGAVYGSTSGVSGDPMSITFKLNVA